MATKYKTVITTAGVAKFAAALTAGGKKVNITTMAVGDGGGSLPEPNAGQVKLVNEVWRQALNKISQDNKNKNYVVAELVIPPETGGFWLREMGLYDDTGTLIAVGNMAESYKPKLEEGSGRAQTLRMVIILSDVASVELSIDTTTVMASQDYVDGKILDHEQSRRHPDATLTDKGFTQLSSATNSTLENLAATPKAVKSVNDALTTLKNSLGTAATQDKTTSGYDVTAGHILQVGDYGLGTAAGDIKTLTSIFDITCTGKYKALGAGSSTPTTGMPAGTGNTMFVVNADNVYTGQWWVTLVSSREFYVGLVNTTTKQADWYRYYNTYFKPVAADVDAVSAENGGEFKKEVRFTEGMSVRNSTGIIAGEDTASFSSANMILRSWYGIGFATTLSGSDVITGYINTRTGRLEMKEQIIPGSYANFDARYVQNIRFGAIQSAKLWMGYGFSDSLGYVITGITNDGNEIADTVYRRALQKNINGSWITVGA